MKNSWKLISLILTTLLLAGCGNGGSGDDDGIATNPLIPGGRNTGTAAFQFVLARAVPSNVDIIEFSGYDADGSLVFGPAPRNKAQEIVLENLPLEIRSFQLNYYDGEFLVGQGEVPVILSANGRVGISDPDFQDVTATNLFVVPDNAELVLGSTRTLNTTVTLSNGETFSVVEEAVYSSSLSNVATVNSQGRVTAVSQGTTTISVSYRGLQATSIITVIPSDG